MQNSQEYLAPRYLTELFPKLSNKRTNFRLRSRENFTQLRTVEPLRFKSLFFPSAIIGWNSLDLDVRNSVSLPTFKAKTRSILFLHTYNGLYDCSFARRASVDHIRLRLGFYCPTEYLVKINSCRVAYLRVQF